MSSCFNLTKWSAEVFLMTADPAFSSYMAELPQCPGLPWCLIQTQVELWLKCSRSAAFYLAPTAPQSPLLFTLYFFFFWGMQFLLIYFLCFFLVCSSFSPCFFLFFFGSPTHLFSPSFSFVEIGWHHLFLNLTRCVSADLWFDIQWTSTHFSSLLLSLCLFFCSHVMQQQWLKLMYNSNAPLIEAFNSFITCKSVFPPILPYICIPFSRIPVWSENATFLKCYFLPLSWTDVTPWPVCLLIICRPQREQKV